MIDCGVSSRRVAVEIPLYTAPDRGCLPLVRKVTQALDDRRLADVRGTVAAELARAEIAALVRPGARIAIAIGSRGIADIATVVAEVVASVRRAGAEPFLVPAMGSHGASTAQGQVEVLEGLGLTEAAVGAPIRATMDTVELGRLADGTPIHFDALAAAADGIVAINRVKPHTAFRGRLESGVAKMLVLGMGKARGVATLHALGTSRFDVIIPEGLALILQRVPVLFGVALVENAYEQLAAIEAIPAAAIARREPQLLELSRATMARLLFDEIDVLVLEEIGKDVSGQGFDPNVVGRNARSLGNAFDGSRVARLVALGMSAGAHGNALGMGELDIVTERLLAAVDLAATYANVIASTHVELGALPIVAATSADAIALAMHTVPGRTAAEVRLVHARSTKDLAEIFVSEGLYADVDRSSRLTFAGPPRPLVVGDEAAPWDRG